MTTTYTPVLNAQLAQHLGPGALTMELAASEACDPASEGFINCEYPAEPECAYLRLPPKDLDSSYANAAFRKGTFDAEAKNYPLILPDMDDRALMLAHVVTDPTIRAFMRMYPQLLDMYSQAFSGFDLSGDADYKRALLGHLKPVASVLFKEHIKRLSCEEELSSPDLLQGDGKNHYDRYADALAQAMYSLRSLVDLCLAAGDPIAYAAFIGRHVEEPLIFMQIAPLYANRLIQIELKALPKGLNAILLQICGALQGCIADPAGSIDELLARIFEAAQLAGLDPEARDTCHGVYMMVAHLIRGQANVKRVLLDRIRREISLGRISPEMEHAAQSGVNMLQLEFYRFCNAIGMVPVQVGKGFILIRFKYSFSIGEYPFGINGYAIGSQSSAIILSSLGKNPLASGQTATLIFKALKAVSVLLVEDKISTLHHELWHAFERRLFGCIKGNDEHLVIGYEYRAISGSMALYNPDDVNVEQLQGLRRMKGSDVNWEAARQRFVSAFDDVKEDDPAAIRLRARELIDAEYSKLFGLTVGDLFHPFRKG